MKVEKNRLARGWPWILVVLWMGLIFYFSQQLQQQSWNLSYTVLGISIQAIKIGQVIITIGLAGVVIIKLKKRGMTIGAKELILVLIVAYLLYNWSIGVRQALVPTDLHHFIRKNAHFFIYLILGGLVKYALTSTGIKGVKAIGIGLLICIVYAISDEAHQLLVPGRGGQLSDVVIDSWGAGLGISLHILAVKFLSLRAKNKLLETN
ncbi:VanZ family protein [Carnobacterium pleistocenium]|uniref:VanZ family protein n=1 Tax=Carnobacterium pleistocenium TaxID=181073 RepID=UPI00068D959B|nr:VanZ family protein [Carnobacterium pleistocenium]